MEVASATQSVKGHRHPIKGALFMVLAVGCFTGLDTLIRYLSIRNPVLLLVWARYLCQAVYTTMLIGSFQRVSALKTGQIRVHVVRGILLSGASIFVVLSLRHLPMAETYSIAFSSPLIATALAVPILGERASFKQWLVIGVGFVGVLITFSPHLGAFQIAFLFPLVMAASNAGYQVMTRLGSRKESSSTLTLYSAVFGAIWLSLFLPWVLRPVSSTDIVLILVAGLLGTIAQLLLAAAVSLAPMSVIAPFSYTQLIWASLFGFVFFGQVPSSASLVGGVVVAVSGILMVKFRSYETDFKE